MRSKLFLLVAMAFLFNAGIAQRRAPGQNPQFNFPRNGSDTTSPANQARKGPKPYDKVITEGAITMNGFITSHKVKDEYFLEIPDSVFNRDLLVVNRIAKAAAGVRAGFTGYAGDQIGKEVVQFVKGPENKVFLKTISFSETATDSTPDGMYRNLKNSSLQPIAASFDVAAFSPNHKGIVIDITKYINGDNDVLFFSAGTKRSLGLTQQIADRSYIVSVRAFPVNIEIRTMKTYNRSPNSNQRGGSTQPSFGQAQGSAEPTTFELNSSIVMLPKVPMKARYFDPRVGYFATSTTDFDANPQGIKKISLAVRWRLEPKPEDVQKYLKGELVEPQKQIVYYIDPTTPKKWVPYLIQGINDWNVAFEQAGFKNAIVGKEAPTNDSTWSLDDARHSAIVYKPSSVANASGPNVNDPRSGEILESHINWYHNVMELVRNWYFVQTSVVDPNARTMNFSEHLMGELIRFVSSHEVGHTLGLRHNFGSSSTVPVEKLRDKNWLDVHGHTPSIMDYARFNYVAQPEDNLPENDLFPRIGEYDKWAIQWGYMWLPQFKGPEDEEGYLNKIVSDSLAKNPRLFFGTETDPNDPRNQSEDLGNNAMVASAYGIKNLKRIIPNLINWTKEPNEGYDNAKNIYGQVVAQFNRYMGHVSKNVGGIEWNPSTIEQNKTVYNFTPKNRQKDAIKFLQDQLFTTPKWLIDKNLFSLIGVDQLNTISTLQKNEFSRLFNPRTIANLVSFEQYDPANAYTETNMLNDLKAGIWSELKTGQAIDIYRRNLQKLYVDALVDLVKPAKPAANAQAQQFPRQGQFTPPTIDNNDGISVIKGHMRTLLAEVRAAIQRTTDPQSKMHLQDVADRLRDGLDPLVTR